MSPPNPTVAGALFATTMSDAIATVVVVVAVLFARFGSVSVVAASAVFVMIVLVAVPGFTRTTMLNVADVAGASSALAQLIVPVPPTAGFVQVNVGPEVCVFDTNVVFVGTVSVIVALCAPMLPTFDTVTV